MVSVDAGVRILRLYAPLSASNIVGVTNADTPVTMTMKGTIGNNGTLKYAVASQPLNGTVVVSGQFVTYTPNPGFVGDDNFTYSVSYGGNTVSAYANVGVYGVATTPDNNSLVGGSKVKAKK
jgi:hypothetical protein